MSAPDGTAREMLAALRLLCIQGHVQRADYERWEKALAGPAGTPDSGRLAAIRAVVGEALDAHRRWANRANPRATDSPYPMANLLSHSLNRVEQIASASRTESGVEPGGGAYLTPADLRTTLSALDEAADELRDRAANCSDCDRSSAETCTTCASRLARATGYDTLAAKLGGE